MSITKKILAIAIILSVVAIANPVSNAQAATAEEIAAQIAALQAQLTALQSQLTTTPASTTSIVGVPTGFTFTKNLKQGEKSDDVKYLQIVLKAQGANIYSGPATGYFGALTKAGVVNFQEKYASDTLTPYGLTKGTGFVGTTTRAKLNAVLGTTPTTTTPTTTTPTTTTPTTTTPTTTTPTTTTPTTTTPTTIGLTVALASDTTPAGTIATTSGVNDPGAGITPLAKITFTNGDATAVNVTTLKLKRTGVSADTTLANVYLYDGDTRLTDAASVSSGYVTFTAATGVVTVPANSSKTVTVASEIATNTSGQTVGVTINAATDITSSASATNGSFPISGNLQSIANATLATIDFNLTTTPTPTQVDPQNDYAVWQNVTTVGNRAVNLSRFSLRMIGSVSFTDLQNFRLYVDGVQVGSAVANLDSNGYATFVISPAKKIETGNRTVKVLADIIGGSSKNFKMSLKTSADVKFIDTEYGSTVKPTANAVAFSARNSGQQDVNQGQVTITKRTDSPSGNVVSTASNVVLAKYDVKATGEKVKVESLRVAVDVANNASTALRLRNGMLFAGTTQIGSTAGIYDINNATAAYTTFNLGSSLILEPGKTIVLEVRADIYDDDGTQNLDTTNIDDIITARIVGGDIDNAQGLVSSALIDAPTVSQDGNPLSISTGGLTGAKYTAYPNLTWVPPINGLKLASFTIAASTTEAVNLNTINVDIDGVTDAFAAASDLSNLYVKYGTIETTKKATVTATSNSWSINYSLPAGAVITADVYADVASSATNGDVTADTGRVDLTVTGQGATSATSATTGEVQGQTMTFGAGIFSVATDGNTPLAQIVAGNQTVTAAKFKFSTVNDTYYVKEVKVKVASATVSGAIFNAILKDGATVLGTKPFDTSSNTIAYFTGLNVGVPMNGSKVLTVDLVLSSGISADVNTSQVNAAITLDTVKFATSQGSETTDTTPGAGDTNPAGNAVYVYKTIPTFTAIDPAPSTRALGSTSTVLYKFRIAAASQGDVAIKQVKLPITITDGGTDGTLYLDTFKLYKGTTDITDTVTIQDQSGNSVEGTTSNIGEGSNTLVVTFDNEEIIGLSNYYDYSVKATPSGFVANTNNPTGSDKVSLYLAGDASHNGTSKYLNAGTSATTVVKLYTSAAAGSASATAANLIWSDNSSVVHAYATGLTSSSDWANGYKVLNLDLDSQSWNN